MPHDSSRRLIIAAVAATLLLLAAPGHPCAPALGPDLEQIMADPDWIGNAPESRWWGEDSTSVYYRAKRTGEDIRDTYRVRMGSSTQRLGLNELYQDTGPQPVYTRLRKRVAWAEGGDIFYRNLPAGPIVRVTRTNAKDSEPMWLTDGVRLAYRSDGYYFLHDVRSGTSSQVSDLHFQGAPDNTDNFDPLRDQQRRTYRTAVEDERRALALAQAQRKRRAGSEPAALHPIYLGKDLAEAGRWLSPDGQHLLLAVSDATAQRADRETNGNMPNYVTLDGPVAIKDVRERVGRDVQPAIKFKLVNLRRGSVTDIDASKLPGRDTDPLHELRANAIDWHIERGANAAATRTALQAPALRALVNPTVHWSPDGSRVAIMVYAGDNKDRWLFTTTTDAESIQLQHRATDPAWINWAYQDYGWLANSDALWFMSEESGYNHLYLKPLKKRRPRALTKGNFVVREPVFNHSGERVWLVANRSHPSEYEVYTLSVDEGELEQLTDLNGVTSFSLSPNEKSLLLHSSQMNRHPDLFLSKARLPAGVTRLTDTVSPTFKSIDWVIPNIVEVPSTHTDRPIYSKLYLPPGHDLEKNYPAVMFVHGAGYTQSTHKGWPYYFREFMFHTLLANSGYVVLDMDYRASKGYGRDWRASIYRNMGHPELEDYLDGRDWLAATQGVDPERIGIYGGSYGGFMTFMALFRAPGAFAAGAALRPVVDFMHYNHRYTSAILNTPGIDPEAYQRSSPINYAEGLEKPLLIAVGMQDDNVFFQDSVLLVQRLLELRKPDFEIALYPLDGHGFTHSDAWLDEYRRIYRLMERYVRGAKD